MPENNRMPYSVCPATRSGLLRVLCVLVLLAVFMMGAAVWHALQARELDVGSNERNSHVTALSIDILILCMPLGLSIAALIKFLLSLEKGWWRIQPAVTVPRSEAHHRRTRRIVKVYTVLVLLATSVVCLLDQELLWTAAEASVGLLSWGVMAWAVSLYQEARVEVSCRMYGAGDPEVKRPTSPEGKE